MLSTLSLLPTFDDLFFARPVRNYDLVKSYTKTRKTKSEDGAVSITIDAPGFNKTNLSAKIVDGELQVVGKREDGLQLTYFDHVGYGATVQAKLKDGLLSLSIQHPKQEIDIVVE